jgi:phosphoglycolate phosphatase
MPIPVDLIIFDFDGTLVNTGDDIADSVNHTLKVLNLPQVAKEEIFTYIGDGVLKLIERATGEKCQNLQEQALKIFSEHYALHMLDHAFLYTGVEDVLEHFGQKRKIILTNKRFVYTRNMAEAMRIIRYFDEIIAADSTPFIKPNPQLIDMILERYPVSRHNTVIIGDGVNDIKLAKYAGIKCGGFLGGLGKPDELIALDPDFTFDHFSELKTMLF